jgi:hypothetical protein
LRERLNAAPMITGHFVEADSPFAFHVDQRETFLDVVARKTVSAHNEVMDLVARYQQTWERIRSVRDRRGQSYRFRFVCHLPTISSVEQAMENGLLCIPQVNFGSRPPVSETRAFPLIVETGSQTGVRVIALGDNYPDSCRVFDLTDLAEYRESIQEARGRAVLVEEINFWEHLSQ